MYRVLEKIDSAATDPIFLKQFAFSGDRILGLCPGCKGKKQEGKELPRRLLNNYKESKPVPQSERAELHQR
jgi:hypothetical protein